ncbi:galactokinase [Alteromonas sp. ASW11-36]|uniref:Galactokinase n=1 Tax=Alteromonas arenosi TaxID=3055817 RepID=A0ABT7SSU1_9ALTE|nr:galactokinase [Alteromonas sp. ASW11-36]MDM7859221.1 galactokinase [Alteromonas sp. ASW11-36]
MAHEALAQAFTQHFGNAPTVKVSAPGRVNLIGEHTDYNEGFVLPCALQFKTLIVAKPREDTIINAFSLQYPEAIEQFDIAEPINPGLYPWGDYLRGVVKELMDAGAPLTGMDIAISSDVPQGSGLSSSAALEVAVGGLFNFSCNLGLTGAQIARTGQLAENNFIDCQCGIMDQLISAEAQFHSALLIDCMDLSTRAVAIPDDLALLVINSNYPRKLADSDYNERRLACEQAAKVMGKSSLRHATLDELNAVKKELSDTVFRRAKHVITENDRVLQAANALAQNELDRLYAIMHEAHLSLKYDFEITVPATDGLVDICMNALAGKGACRQTGGGFGGAVICLCAKHDVQRVINAVNNEYEPRFKLHPDIMLCEPHQGLCVGLF